MVRYFALIAAAMLIGSCHEQPKTVVQKQAVFDTSSYKKDRFAKRVYEFLQSRTETKSESNYTAIFVNTSMCSVCTMGNFEEIRPYLQKTKEKTFIFANDSLVTGEENSRLKLIYLKKKEYKSRQIFHEKIYLYRILNRKIKAIPLERETIDSLNAIVN